MKNKIFVLASIAASCVALTSCSFFDSAFGGNSSNSTHTTKRHVGGIHNNLKMIENTDIGYEFLPLHSIGLNQPLNRSELVTYFMGEKTVPFVVFDDVLDAIGEGKEIIKRFQGDNIVYERTHRDKTFYVSFDPTEDIIYTNTYNFLGDSNYAGSRANNYQSEITEVKDRDNIVIDLNNYDMDILVLGTNDIVLPVALLNTMFFAPAQIQFLYNSDCFYIYNESIGNKKAYYQTRSKNLNNTLFSNDMIKARNQQLEFIFDYYYGLKDMKQIHSGYKYLHSNPKIIDSLNSQKPEDTNLGYEYMLLHGLQDGHTNMGFSSYYKDVESVQDLKMLPYDLSNELENEINLYEKMSNDYANRGLDSSKIYFSGNTAFIKFDSFDFEDLDNLVDEHGYFYKDAWKYSTFINMYVSLDMVRDKSLEVPIKNVVIDLTTNGGGMIGAIPEALSFLTDREIVCASRNGLVNSYEAERFSVDNDFDGDKYDQDGFTEFNYYILVSPYTFSSANTFTAIAKYMHIAKVIGMHTGGGMCTVGNIALIDGSTFTFSSNFILSGLKRTSMYLTPSDFFDIENGITPDYEIPMDKFYDFDYINNFINSLN